MYRIGINLEPSLKGDPQKLSAGRIIEKTVGETLDRAVRYYLLKSDYDIVIGTLNESQAGEFAERVNQMEGYRAVLI